MNAPPWICAALLAAFARPAQLVSTSVGLPTRIEQLVVSGSELEVAPADAKTPLVLRILATYPHGDSFRYDFEFWGLDPGDYDLRSFLRRKDGSADIDALPPMPVAVRSILPADRRTPNAPAEGEVPSLGGYRTLLVVGSALWLAGLGALLFVGRKRRRAAEASRARPLTLAERLRPLVERACAGQLSRSERAQLELSLVAFWRRKLGLDGERPADALKALHDHAEAGPLLRSLERWLHAPAPPETVDIAGLLEPYRNLPADALEAPRELAAARGER